MQSRNKSLNFGHYVPNDQVLNKKIPGNPKYQHVKPAIYTGHNVQRQINELKDKQKNSYHKKDEVFNRIKFTNFVELLVEAAKVKLRSENKLVTGSEDAVKSSNGVENSKERLVNVITGVGEIDLANQKKQASTATPKIEKDYPYLLLDVRDKDHFLQCHIKTAKHYPSALLSRTNGYETEELKIYKNRSLEIIILYDEDETIASRVATTLIQRGYDNVFLLTGGLKYCNEVFPRKPLSVFFTSQLPDTSTSVSATVQIKNISTGFSQEDINIIEQYLDYPRDQHSASKARSHSSYHKSERQNTKEESLDLKPESAGQIYRRGSNSSSKNIENSRLNQSKSATGSRTNTVKKAPWK